MMGLYDALKTVFSSSHFLWSSDKSLNLKSARITPVTHLIDALCEMSSLLWKRRCMQQVWGMCVRCVFKEDWTYSRNCWCWQDGFSTATQLQQPRTCGAALLKARSIYCKIVGGRGCACCNFIKSKQKNPEFKLWKSHLWASTWQAGKAGQGRQATFKCAVPLQTILNQVYLPPKFSIQQDPPPLIFLSPYLSSFSNCTVLAISSSSVALSTPFFPRH